MFPIFLSIPRSATHTETSSVDQAERVLKRDAFTCRFCGLEDSQNTVLFNGDPAQHERAVTADVFCASCFDLEQVKRGTLLHLPGVEKDDFHHLIRTVYLVMALGGPEEQEEAEAVLEQILAFATPVEGVWGTSKASDFGKILKRAPDQTYEKRINVFENLLLLVHPSCIPKKTIGSWIQRVRQKGLGSLNAWKFIFEAHFSQKDNE